MNLARYAECGRVPDGIVRWGIRRVCGARLRREGRRGDPARATAELARSLAAGPIAVAADRANAQHYEVPARFFEAVLGPRLKYSCGYFPTPAATLAEAEEAMLALTCERAGIEDGMTVLDLGCGWGSLALWIAEKYPRCRVTAVSNSHGQRRFIEGRARARGWAHVRVLTENVAAFEPGGTYDRVVSVEMFEHLRNYRELFRRIAGWLAPGGKLFAHVFCHKASAYPFEVGEGTDWMARHFFTGGLMPSFDLFDHFAEDLAVERRWRVDGTHYARTCEAWLANLDANRAKVLPLFPGPRPRPRVAVQRWRMFLMACAELFAYRGGSEWFVGHYRFGPTAAARSRRAVTTRPEAAWTS